MYFCFSRGFIFGKSRNRDLAKCSERTENYEKFNILSQTLNLSCQPKAKNTSLPITRKLSLACCTTLLLQKISRVTNGIILGQIAECLLSLSRSLLKCIKNKKSLRAHVLHVQDAVQRKTDVSAIKRGNGWKWVNHVNRLLACVQLSPEETSQITLYHSVMISQFEFIVRVKLLQSPSRD
jgi:hypothetical protein